MVFRPRWTLRTQLLLFLAIAVGCGMWLGLREPKIHWLPYDAATLARCKARGWRVLVVYYAGRGIPSQTRAFCPYHDHGKEIGKLFRRMDIVAMKADLWHQDLGSKETEAIRRDLAALGVDVSQLQGSPLVVIYDNQMEPTVIQDDGSTDLEYAVYILQRLRDYERDSKQPREKKGQTPKACPASRE